MDIRIIYSDDAASMTEKLISSYGLEGKIGRKDSRIILKPNFVVPSPADNGATTHIEIITTLIRYLQKHGFENITVAEGAWVGASTSDAFSKTGLYDICRKYGVRILDLKKDSYRKVSYDGIPMEISETILNADYLINLPVLKGHCQTVMTCALKNCKGCLPDREKRRFHAEGLMEPIAALAAALKPDLTIVDSICGDLNFEEGGNPVPTGRMLLGTDMVQLDTYGCRLMGLDPEYVPYIGLAERWGAGSSALEPGDLIRLNEPSDAAGYPKPSGLVANLTRNVQANNACSACYASLVRALYHSRSREAIAIGQGWKGIPFDGLGVGNCCNCAQRQVKGCPPSAEDILQALQCRRTAPAALLRRTSVLPQAKPRHRGGFSAPSISITEGWSRPPGGVTQTERHDFRRAFLFAGSG